MSDKDFSHLHVLVIEKNKKTRDFLLDNLYFYFEDISYAADGCEGLNKIQLLNPDIIISDIEIPYINGIDLIKKIKKATYKPIVIFTTSFYEKEYLLAALDIKVDAYLIKPIKINVLLNKIKESLDTLITTDLKYKKLSSREYEVFLDLANGLKPSEIALKYNIKAKTVSTYRNRIFEKMFFETNAQLITYAVKNNLI